MKTFLAVYLGTQETTDQSGWDKLSQGERQEREARGMAAWMEWAKVNAGAIVDHGAPLGKTKHVSATGVADTKNSMAGYVILRAQSHAEAARLFEQHPHFSIFPGDSVEIMECLPMPGA